LRVTIVGLILFAGMAVAQLPPDPAVKLDVGIGDTGPASDTNPEAGRILGVIPDNKIVPSDQAATAPALTTGGKFMLAWKDTIDPFTFVLAGFYAGIAQWQNDYPTWQQGSEGYGKRFGAAYADQVIGNYFTEAIVPALAHEDPRYFRKGSGGGWARINYALSRTLVTRTDRGKRAFNYSEIVGNAAAAGIANLYYPASQRTIGETGEKFAIQVLSDSAFNVLLEFWPDMRRMAMKRVPFRH
jgi:hypothetical protein